MRRMVIAGVGFWAMTNSCLLAEVPHWIACQGKLTGGTDPPLTGTHEITFRFYTTETHGLHGHRVCGVYGAPGPIQGETMGYGLTYKPGEVLLCIAGCVYVLCSLW